MKQEMTEEILFDDRAQAYLRSGDVAAAIAEQHFGIDVDDITRQRWRELMGLLREVDTWVDDTGVSPDETLDSLRRFDLFGTRYPYLAPASLGPEIQATMLKRTARILKFGQLATQTTSVRRFVAYRTLEGCESVRLFGDCASSFVLSQPSFGEEFLPALGVLGASATLCDSLIDGRIDARDGKLQLEPGKEYYIVVTGAMLHLARGKLRCLMHRGPITYGGLKVAERLANRIKNGIPSYSNLYRFKPHK